jgi:hypothetical protein
MLEENVPWMNRTSPWVSLANLLHVTPDELSDYYYANKEMPDDKWNRLQAIAGPNGEFILRLIKAQETPNDVLKVQQE